MRPRGPDYSVCLTDSSRLQGHVMDFLRQGRIASANWIARNSAGALTGPGDEGEQLLQDFVDDISLSTEELNLFLAMPEVTIADARRLVDAGHAPVRSERRA